MKKVLISLLIAGVLIVGTLSLVIGKSRETSFQGVDFSSGDSASNSGSAETPCVGSGDSGGAPGPVPCGGGGDGGGGAPG